METEDLLWGKSTTAVGSSGVLKAIDQLQAQAITGPTDL